MAATVFTAESEMSGRVVSGLRTRPTGGGVRVARWRSRIAAEKMISRTWFRGVPLDEFEVEWSGSSGRRCRDARGDPDRGWNRVGVREPLLVV